MATASPTNPIIYSLTAALLALILAHRISALTINMVEGHSVHRLASRFRSKLVGRKFTASSPNGRFAEGAAAIDGRVLSRMEAVGKNLFAFFSSSDDLKDDGSGGGGDGNGEDEVVVHVHFGMSGVWAVYNSELEEEPDVKPTTRLRLEEVVASATNNNNKLITHLSAMTVAHGDPSLFSSKKASLGQDPLRSDADPNLLYEKVIKSKKSIGQIIMDQSYFAGPGNIYRAEILFLAGVYPTTLGMQLDRPSFDKVWNVSVKLLRRGYDTGSILTVCPEEDASVAARGERRYIYNKSACARCGGRVSSWDMSGRTCYACEGGSCQPKMKGQSSAAATGNSKKAAVKKEVQKKGNAAVAEGKKKNDKKPKQHVPFISHCAPMTLQQRLEQGGAEQLTIAEIRSVMEQMVGEDANGALPPKSARKAVHVEALNNLLLKQQNKLGKARVKKERATAKTTATTKKTASKPLPPPLVSAEDAAREKSISGENRAVEHVAELSREQAVKAISVTPSPPASVAGANRAMSGVAGVSKRKGSEDTEEAENTSKDGSKMRSRRRLKYDA